MRRGALNIGLLVVAAGLGVAVFFSQKKEDPGPPLTALTADALTKITLTHPDAPAVTLEKQGGAWRLTAPVKAPADEFEVAALTSLATAASKDKVDGAAPKDLELDPPRYTIALNDIVVAFGGVEPLQYRRYVKVGETVHLIEDPPSAALDKDYADLVAKPLFPAAAEIERIVLPKLTLARGADGQWTVTPRDPKATADGMQKLADGWKAARSMWNELARDEPVNGDRVTVSLKDGAQLEFVVAATDPQLKLHRPDLGVTFVLSKALADDLLKLPEPPKEAPPPVEPKVPAEKVPEKK